MPFYALLKIAGLLRSELDKGVLNSFAFWPRAFLSLASCLGLSPSFQLIFCSGGVFCANAKISNKPLLPITPARVFLALYISSVCTVFA
jgi:hypothetical protein